MESQQQRLRGAGRPDPEGMSIWDEKQEEALMRIKAAEGASKAGGRSRFIRFLIALGFSAFIFVCIGYFDVILLWAGIEEGEGLSLQKDNIMINTSSDAAVVVDKEKTEQDPSNKQGATVPSSSTSLRQPTFTPPPTVAVPNPPTTPPGAPNIENDIAHTKAAASSSKSCADVCRINQYDHGYDLLDRNQLLELANHEKEKLLTKLYKDYGKDNFDNIFVDPEDPTKFRGITERDDVGNEEYAGKSYETLKRKILIKLLSVQIKLEEDANKSATQSGSSNDCVCSEKKKQQRLLKEHNPNNNIEPDIMVGKLYEKYVWATGGHSSAAGHGNMYNESYTAYMDRDLTPFLASFGIELDARNYAMGGTSSGMEISSCWEQVFGTDVDLFTWDFGMTDGRATTKSLHYTYRGYQSTGRPVLITLRASDSNFNKGLAKLVGKALPTFTMKDQVWKDVKEAIPDSAGKTDKEINEMPDYVRNFKCMGAEKDMLERGDPYCSDERYTSYYCPDRSKKAWWHQGYKAHAVDGHFLSLFLIQTFMDALKDLSQNDVKDPKTILAQLKEIDDERFQRFVKAPIVNELYGSSIMDDEKKNLLKLFVKGPSVCRTGRLPAKSRFLGYMSQSDKTGDIAALGNETYETALDLLKVMEYANESMEDIPLVWDQDRKKNDERQWHCSEQIIKPDYKDWYHVYLKMGTVKMTFPNKKERAAYKYEKSKFKGLLAMVLKACDWGKCGESDIRIDEDERGYKGNPIEDGRMEMTVNGKAVKSFQTVNGISVLVGDHGMYWEPSNNDDYEIAVRVKEEKNFFRISSIVLF